MLLEWTAKNSRGRHLRRRPAARAVPGRAAVSNHNGGLIAFNPLATPGSADYGLLYVGVADGGSGGDPFNARRTWRRHSARSFASIRSARTAPTANTAFPPTTPSSRKTRTLGEIYAYGVRNPQRFSWDSKNGNMFLADIGQNMVEKVSFVTAGANLGWNIWEGDFRYGPGVTSASRTRGARRA